MRDVKVVGKRAGTTLNDGVKEYFVSFLCGFYGLNSGT
jgi:hypothetical protein